MANDRLADFENIFQQIGIALHTWARVEDELCRLFCFCFDPDNASPADQAFWAIVSFEAKLSMVGAVINARFNHKPDIKTDWLKLKDALVARNKARNKIAHGTVVRMQRRKRGVRQHWETFLSPYHFARQYKDPPSLAEMTKPGFDPRPKERLKASELKRQAKSFHEMQGQVEAFATQLGEIARAEGAEMRGGKALPHRQVDL